MPKETSDSYLRCRWEPLDDLEDGALQLVESLREDIIQIERELVEGWLGAVPDFEAWEVKAQQVGEKEAVGQDRRSLGEELWPGQAEGEACEGLGGYGHLGGGACEGVVWSG